MTLHVQLNFVFISRCNILININFQHELIFSKWIKISAAQQLFAIKTENRFNDVFDLVHIELRWEFNTKSLHGSY